MMLALFMAALGMNAIVPAGHMVTPSTSHFLTIAPCPQTNALVRAFAAADTQEPMTHGHVDHTAMDHAAMGHVAMDHAAMGHSTVDHAAMGHHAQGPDDRQPASTASKTDCAFSALAFSATVPPNPALLVIAPDRTAADARRLPILAIVPVRHLRPPLRAPPPKV